MKLFRICMIMWLVVGCTTMAMGQYGLYGSPDTINMSQQAPNMVPSYGYTAPSSTYTASTAPTRYVPSSTQPLPVKPVATYSPMGSQYSTPAYSRPTYYTAYTDQSTAVQPAPTQAAAGVPQQMPAIQSPAASQPATMSGAQQTPGIMNQMLAEQGQSNCGPACSSEGYAPYGDQSGVYRPSLNRCQQAGPQLD